MAERNRNTVCFECESGLCHEVTEPYEVQLPDGDRFTIPLLSVIRCDACGEISIPAASAKVIDAAIWRSLVGKQRSHHTCKVAVMLRNSTYR